MVKPNTPNAGQTVELLVETIRERILDRIDELDIEKKATLKGQTRGYYKQGGNRALYDAVGKLEKQLKSLKRGLGGLLTSDPNKIINPKTGETWGQLVQELVHKNTVGDALAKRLEKFGTFVYAKSNVNPGKVGHHRTGLGILREILKNKPFDYRTKFKNIAAVNGYQIGEEFIDFIDPAAHKEFTKNVGKALSERLGYTSKADVPENLMNAIADRYAHAKQFGGNVGWDVPTGWLKDGVDEETLFKFSQPYLEASKRGAASGRQVDEILTKGVWETSDELIEQLDKVTLNQTDDLFDIFGNPLKPNPLTKVKSQTINEEVLTKLGLSKTDLNPKLLSMGNDVMSLRKIAKGGAIAGIMGVSVIGTGASAVETDARVKIAKKTNNWMDKTQAGISGFSLANDLGSYTGIWALPGGVLSTGADLLNMTIDSARTPQTKEESEKEIKDQTESDKYNFTTF